MFESFRSLLNLFQINGPKNEMHFWPILLFLKRISKTIYNVVAYVLLNGKNSSFSQNGKNFYGDASFSLVYLNSLAPNDALN